MSEQADLLHWEAAAVRLGLVGHGRALRRQIRSLVNDKRLAARKIARRLYVTRKSVENLIEGRP